jgi:hypothetical protein
MCKSKMSLFLSVLLCHPELSGGSHVLMCFKRKETKIRDSLLAAE